MHAPHPRTRRSPLPLAAIVALALGLAAGCTATPPAEQAGTPAEAPAAAPAPDAPATPVDGVVAMTVDGAGFHPNHIAAKVGQPITLAITRTTDETCGTEIVIPALSIDRKLPLNERVEVTLTPDSTGTISFACGMDMLKGSIVVE